MSQRLCLPAERPCILSFSGPDAVRFLNGQITQDTSRLSQQSLPACVTDAKGRLQFFIRIFTGADESSLWVSCPKKQSEGLRERLERYLIADDVEVDDLSGQWALVHSSASDDSAAFTRTARGCFGDGFDCWWKTEELPKIESIDDHQAERLRIAERIPVWGHELIEGMLPPEAGLDRTAISYQKGCYIGQEVLSRIKTAGKLNRRLAAFEIQGSSRAKDILMLDSREVGQLTSCAPSPAKNATFAALGYLKKRGFDQTGFEVTDATGKPTGLATFAGWA